MKKLLSHARTFAPLLLTALIICLPLVAVAQINNPERGFVNNPESGVVNNPETCAGGRCSLENPLKVTSFCYLLELILRGLVILGLPVAVLFLMWTGFQFILARGSDKKLPEAKRNLRYTLLGIGIFLGAWTIAQIIKATLQALGVGAFGSC